MENPGAAAVTRAFRDAAEEVGDVLARGDQARFAAIFDEVRGFFGAFGAEALERSRAIIDKVVELGAGRLEADEG
jgi:hypothetical protein